MKDNDRANFEFDHAWDYFKIHANQRITLFKFYIVIYTLFVTACGYLIVKFNIYTPRHTEEYFVVICSLVFIIITIIFCLIDERNRRLIHLSEDALKIFERDNFLKSEFRIFNNEEISNCLCAPRHTCCFRCFYFLSIISCFILIAYSLNNINFEENCWKNRSATVDRNCINVIEQFKLRNVSPD